MSGVARDAAFRPAAKRPVRDADQGKGSGETGRFPQLPGERRHGRLRRRPGAPVDEVHA
jgi:hypothetical protein